MSITRTVVLLAFTCLAVGAPRVAQAQARHAAVVSSKHGSIGGDVFVTTDSGGVKKGVAATVQLLKYSPSSQRLVAMCRQLHALADSSVRTHHLARIHGMIYDAGQSQSEFRTMNALYDTVSKLDARMTALDVAFGDSAKATSVQSATTDINAHFQFVTVPSGQYLLLSSMTTGSRDYEWLQPVAVIPGTAQSVSLDNSEARSDALCSSRLP